MHMYTCLCTSSRGRVACATLLRGVARSATCRGVASRRRVALETGWERGRGEGEEREWHHKNRICQTIYLYIQVHMYVSYTVNTREFTYLINT